MDDPPHTVLVVVDHALHGRDAVALSARIARLLRSSPATVVVCDVAALAHPDIGTIDALARLQLVSRRLGCRVRLLHASGELRDLLAFMGLAGVLPCLAESVDAESVDEVVGQPEEWEEPLGVEEERDAADPPA